MSESKVRIDDFTKTLSAELNEYSKEVQNILNTEVEDVLDEGKKKIREMSPVGHRKRKKYKKYKNDWVVDTTKTSSGIHGQIGNNQYRLVHLLEDGHLTPDKVTRTKPQPHVKPTQDWVEEELMNRLESKL